MKVSRRYFFGRFLGGVALGGAALCQGVLLVPSAAHAKGKGSDGGKGKGGGKGGNTNSDSARSRGATPPGAGIEHDNGMRETIRKGRYEMLDAQGRTVVNRPATAMDYLRLKVAR